MSSTPQSTQTELPIGLSVPCAARLGGFSTATGWRLIATGELPSIKVGKRRLILRDDLTAWLASHRVPTTQAA